MESDEEDFVYVGTPIEREEESKSRKQKSLALSSSHLRTLPSWKQEVTDEEGRRRFHGAFTGGFSAGYYNTVGSKEGWTPQTFSSSRKSRAEVKKQSVLDFLDDDEKAEMEGHLLGTSSQFDTFGFTAADVARKQAEKEQKQRPSAIPGPVPDELVVPVTESIGVKLLLKMGWRHGQSIKDSHTDAREARRDAKKAFVTFSTNDATPNFDGPEPIENLEELAADSLSSRGTPVYVRQPKQDLYGLGYDPYKHAPEFREKKRSRLSDSQVIRSSKPFASRHEAGASKLGRLAPGFGIGALEELDVEDEDIYSSGYDYAITYVASDEEPSIPRLEDKQKPTGRDGAFPGFRPASNSEYQLERFDPPIIPKDFVARHKFPGPLDTSYLSDPSPPEVPPPEDKNLKVMIEGVAALVARCGKLFEDLSREKNKSNPLFDFLNGGTGHDYYAWKLWEGRQKHKDQNSWRPDENLYSTVQKMTAEGRGRILGEKPLIRTSTNSISSRSTPDEAHVKSDLSDTFATPEAFNELLQTAKPFKDNPAKQERFEQFLKDKYQGGLRSTASGKADTMSEDSRACERLDFEAAAEAIEKEKSVNQAKLSAQQLMDFTMATGLQFTSGGFEQSKASTDEQMTLRKEYPKREEFQWRPAPLLCKRFDIVDPYMGKPPPAPRMRSKLDSLIFTPDSAKMVKTVDQDRSSGQSSIPLKNSEDLAVEMNKEPEVVEVENVERPVDLFKAIFSDDSDDEGDEPSDIKQTEDTQKKTEAASAALSRLVAGDFLESLGKELGLEVPPDGPPPTGTSRASSLPTNTAEKDGPVKLKQSVGSESGPPSNSPRENITLTPLLLDVSNDKHDREKKGDLTSHVREVRDDVKHDDKKRANRKDKYNSDSSSSENRSRKRHKKHRRRDDSSYDESSDDSRDRYRSRSRDDRKRSSRRKHRRRKHSKHR